MRLAPSRAVAGVIVGLGLGLGLGCGGTERAPEVVQTTQGALTSVCGANVCGDATATIDTFGRWPGGEVSYTFDAVTTATWQSNIRLAMDDWERLVGGPGTQT